MKPILKPIALNEKSYNVNLLHKVLAVFRLPVSKEEVAQNKAGQDTLKKVRTLQAKLNVSVDESTMVDEATALAIAEALEKRGLTTASRSFTVTGTVRLQNGAVKKRQQLLAFDLDLRGVAVYRNINNIEEIKKNGGFEFLGQTVSDNLGNYRITFYDWQYRQAERKKADVVVYAVEKEEIIGLSRMVNSEDYSDKGLVRDLDIIITQKDKRTEYDVLMQALNAFLKENNTSLREIAASHDQLVFTAGELDVDLSRLTIAARAGLLAKEEEQQLIHELLYGIGRQNIRLVWGVLYKKQGEELSKAIAKSVDEQIIRKYQKREVDTFIHTLLKSAVNHVLDDKDTEDKNTLNAMLSNALPEKKQRIAFMNALNSFKGTNFREFWSKHLKSHPEFKNNEKLISDLLFTQQVTLLTGNHQALVKELQVSKKLDSPQKLIELEKGDWSEIIKKTGVPDFIEGKNDEEKIERYAGMIQGLLNAAFPTQRIAKMVGKNELSIEKNKISKSIGAFLSRNEKLEKDKQFDFARSRIHDFKKEIKAVAGKDYDEVRSELMKIQRVFQISTRPEVMSALLEKKLHSAYSIASIPRNNFTKRYTKYLGGEQEAFAVHQRASHINTRAEMAAMHFMEYIHGLQPRTIMDKSEYKKAMKTIEDHLPNPTPNYAELFGSPDICECKHCRSVYSAASYFVDLLRFLEKTSVTEEHTLYDILIGKREEENIENIVVHGRRPDLAYLQLTCENTNTLIPYIDLVNEVMEYYTAKGSLQDSQEDYKGHDTGETTAEELRANPQNFIKRAYEILGNTVADKPMVYPFTLPYHQPLDVIRTYSDHLKVSRYEAMKAMNPDPEINTIAERAIGAESINLSQEEYAILTGEVFNIGTSIDAILSHVYYGYTDDDAFAKMQEEPDEEGNSRGIRPLLERTGLAYTDLVELVKTLFINPHQEVFQSIEKVLFYLPPSSEETNEDNTLYARLKGIADAEPVVPVADEDILAALDEYNKNNEPDITADDFAQRLADHFDDISNVLTLFEPQSRCALDTTKLRTIHNIYDEEDSEISETTWSKMHRFIRLWRKLGWTIHELDLMLAALGEDDITSETIRKLESISLLKKETKLPINQLAVLWGNIDTYGDKSLYKKLFLNKAVQQIDDAFKADEWGNYLQSDAETLAEHKSAILAAFRIREEDLDAILKVATVTVEIDDSDPDIVEYHPIDPDADPLKLHYLSIIYRYVVLAKALKIKVPDLCKLIRLFDASPFSEWRIAMDGTEEFTKISPDDTYKFYKLARSTKEAGFKPAVLEYILQGTIPTDSRIGLKKEKVFKTAKDISDAFAAIEQEHPETPAATLTSEILIAKLSLTFQHQIVSQFMEIIEGTSFFETMTDTDLDITIPDDLNAKYTYTQTSGRLTCAGVMSNDEKTTLKDLPNTNTNFDAAVDELYAAPETFIQDNFHGVFSSPADLYAAKETLLDHPAQTPPASLDDKLLFIYERFLPLLKSKLRKDAITQHIAALIGLSEEATALLIAGDIDALIAGLSNKGFSAIYFNEVDWSNPVPAKLDRTINFFWGTEAPYEDVRANNFSVRWKAYIAAPASGEYTLMVEVEEADEVFKLYLGETLILEKLATDTVTSKEYAIKLNAAQMHLLTLEYAETTGNAGVRLCWKTATTAPEIIPASVAFPAAIIDDFAEQAIVFHQAAKFILGFEISETELNHFINYAADFASIDFKTLNAEHWERMHDYTSLRNSVPQAQAQLTDVFVLANKGTSSDTVEGLGLINLLHLTTAWDLPNLQFLTTTPNFTLAIDAFKNEIALNRLLKVMQIVTKTGISAKTIAEWGAAETGFDNLHEIAQLLKNSVKAKYGEEDWLDIAGDLSNKIRENQKQALISYLLTQQDIIEWGARDADGLFEYLLIDVQMEACMDTSRIVQANAAIQMFVNRCLLNLEKDVSPEVIDKDHWEWMKNYRVWEVNRKIFLYPENWLEPEWRNNRSEFFKELESYLVQNDITERSVEQGFRNYLTNLNEVANLEVCGMHQEDDDEGELKYLHVFARTHNAPYKFFYRTWHKMKEHGKWSAWEKVQLDIRCVEDGDNSGVHLIPIVWKKRLFLFWPEFIEKQKNPPENSNETLKSRFDSFTTIQSLKPIKYWEIRLAWSEYVDGKWSLKQLSKEFVEGFVREPGVSLKDFLFTPNISSDTQELTITVFNEANGLFLIVSISEQKGHIYEVYPAVQVPAFKLSDIQSPVLISVEYIPLSKLADSTYIYKFSNRTADSTLELQNDVYLQNNTNHKLLPVDTIQGADITLDSPFFFSDAYRTYFVRPVDINIDQRLKNAELYRPFISERINESEYKIRFSNPNFISDENISREVASSRVSTIPSTHYIKANSEEAAKMVSAASGETTGSAIRATMMPVDTVTAVADANLAVMSMGGRVRINAAFAGDMDVMEVEIFRRDKGLEFHTFYHPFSSKYVTNLNQGGLSRGNKPPEEYPPGLMESDTEDPEMFSDDGTTFVDCYRPNFDHGLVQPSQDDERFEKHTYYKENVCFDVYGANSLYNWELFFHAPLYIATRLSKNGKYEKAMKWFHYIFDPTTDVPEDEENGISRYWKVLPFKTTDHKRLEEWFKDLNEEDSEFSEMISEWRDNPFDPHLVASNRDIAHMKHVVIKYVENLIDWGDSLFRQFTRESVYEAIQLYVIANHILGPRPEFVPRRGETRAETYDSLKGHWDDFSNTLVQLENIFPYSSEVIVDDSSTPPSLLGVGEAFYFCIPPNDRLLKYWDTVADRLFKIRHCQDIDGVERKLALFAPPISPEALIQAASQGLSLGSILADLSSPPPIYRFSYLLQKANEFCADVKALGSSLLAALEKKDGEELGRLRASHETNMLELVTAIRERQVLEAKARKENLQKARETAAFRLQHYIDLLGNESVTVPAEPTLSATLTADSQLPADTRIEKIETDVDEKLEESDERGVKLIPKEKEDLEKSWDAMFSQQVATGMEGIASGLSAIPNFYAFGTPYGVGATSSFGGSNLGSATSSAAKIPQIFAAVYSYQAAQASKMAGFIRRDQGWTLDANLAARQIIELDKQITSADIGIQIAKKELENHKQQIENNKQIELFLKDKFTNQELYQWMKEQLFTVYKQSYNLAYEMAKKAEKAYKYEMGTETASFIQYGYWDNSKQGLVSGEKLQLALRQLEKSYLEDNRRELELTKSISLALLNPLALIELRETGKCYVSLPEELFDLDFQGHYFRRIKSASLSIPCIAGPYTTVNCSLRLLKNTLRIDTTPGEYGYQHNHDAGLWTDDTRFRSSIVPVTSIATSKGQNDAGMFEFNFRDERYLPFEGAGTISDWLIELGGAGAGNEVLRQFDYTTISDVILHLNYTARESGGLFKDNALAYIVDFVKNSDELELPDMPLMRMFSMKHEFPTEWHRFLHPAVEGGEQVLNFTVGKERFPFFTQDSNIVVMKIEVFTKCTQTVEYDRDYHMVLSYFNSEGDAFTSPKDPAHPEDLIALPQNDSYGGLNKATINVNDAGLTLDELDIAKEMSMQVKRSAALDYTSLAPEPEELEDIFLVFHYKIT